MQQETQQQQKVSANLEKAIEKGLKYAENLHQMLVSADYYNKQKLQYLLFPEGISYDKENNTVLTTSVNILFSEITVQEKVLAEIKKGNLLQDCLLGSSVGMAGFEPATSWSQTRRDTGLRYIPN